LLIKIPESYIEPTITIRIYKGDSVVEVTKSVIDGYATIFLDEELPDGSPIYEVFMFNPTTLEIVELQASGDPVTSLIFQVTAGTSLQNQFKLDY